MNIKIKIKMLRTITLTFFFFCIFFANAQQWNYVGSRGIGNGMGHGFYQSLALDATGTPYVAYVDVDHNYKISVIRYQNNDWEWVGTPGISTGSAWNIVKIKINPVNNQPYVLFKDDTQNHNISLMYFDGSTWQSVGNYAFTTNGGIYDYDLTFSSTGVPYVSFRDANNSSGISVMKYDNNSWQPVGNPSFAVLSSAISNTDIEMTSNDLPVVGFNESSGGTARLSVMQFDGSDWNYVGSSQISNGSASYIDVEIDSNDQIYVACKDDWTTIVRYFDGSSWQILGQAFPANENLYYHDLEISPGGEVYLGYQIDTSSSDYMNVKRFVNNNWQLVGTPDFTGATATYTQLELDTYGNIYVAFQDSGAGDSTSVMFYQNTGSIDKTPKNQIIIYPNPVETDLFIKNSPGFTSYKIYNLQNQVVRSGLAFKSISITNLVPGIYLLEISGKKHLKIIKFIKL